MRGQVISRGERTWLVRIYLGREVVKDEDGNETSKRKYKGYTYHGTKRDAQLFLASLLNDIRTGAYVEPTNMKVREYLERWLNDYARPSTRPRTFESYAYLTRTHLSPAIGDIPLSKLAPMNLQRLYSEKLDAGLSPATVRRIHAAIHKALECAVKWQLVGRNVADAVQVPKQEKREMAALDGDAVRRFLGAAKEDRLYALFLLAVTTGMRQGEMLGLRWQDVDFDADTITIRQTLQRLRGGQGLTFQQPKTAKSRRLVEVTAPVIEALKRHHLEQKKERLQAGPLWQDNGLVFCTVRGTPLEAQNVVNRHFKPLLEKAGLPPVRFHDMRHTHASLLLREGVHPKIVSERLGHSNIGITLDTYSHVMPGMQREAASKLDALLFGEGAKKEKRQG